MKLITDDGTEHSLTGRTQAYELIKKFLPDVRFGPKAGTHIETTPSGLKRFKVYQNRKVAFGPSRLTEEEAAADYQDFLSGVVRVPAKVGSEEFKAAVAAGRSRAYERQRSLSSDGQVHIKAPVCGACGETGHRRHNCPKSGWVKKVYVRKGSPSGRKPKPCEFCKATGHKIAKCPARRDAIMARLRRVA